MPVNHEQHIEISDLPTLADLTSEQIVEQSEATGEPEWLITWRTIAWDFFVQAPPPQWRRTDLTSLQPAEIKPLFGVQSTFLSGDQELVDNGVIFSTLADAVQHNPQHVRERLGTAISPQGNKFSALRAALWQDGVFLYVPPNVEVTVPLRARYLLAEGSQAMFAYSLIILGHNAKVTFIEEFDTRAGGASALVGPTTEIFVGEGSKIQFISIQRGGSDIYHIGGQMIVHNNNASSEWTSIALGSKVQHIEAEARMQGDGSRVDWLGATFASQQQNLVIGPWLRHIGSNAESLMDFKTVVTDKAYSVFDGMIKIEHESRGTSTRLEEHAVHLGTGARSDSIPGLRIDTNDVAKAGHASTSGQVDEEQLFYMQSRGIDKTEARRLIVMGFFEPALNTVPLDDLRESLIETIEAKI